MELSDQELFLRLRNFEDFFVERKTSSDKQDWLTTAVAFANSAPIGYPAVLFIGVRNDGTIEEKGDVPNLDKLQQTFSKIVSEVYPPIPTFTRVLSEGGKQFLAIIIPGSEARPHFAGHSYVRDGSETKRASAQQFEALLAQRNSKVYEIMKWKDKEITVSYVNYGLGGMKNFHASQARVVTCDQFFVTLHESGTEKSYPIERLVIFHDDSQKRLKLEVHPP